MPLFIVTRRSDNAEVYRYHNDVPVEWAGMEFATHSHVAQVEPEAAPAPAPEPVRISKTAFRNRFAASEKVAIELASLHDPTLPANHERNLLAAALRVSMADQRDASFIDLGRPDTRAGVQQLEAVGLLSPGRAAEILDTPAQPVEVWNG